MSFIRYTASADNTIVNAFQPNLRTRGTGANAGRADVVEVFSIYGRQATASQELSRYLVKFPISSISADRTAGKIPGSGSVSFYMRMSNAKTSKTVPVDYKLVVAAITTDWQEGIGLDLEGYKDKVNGNIGSDWIQARKGTNWGSVGGDYDDSTADYWTEQTFETGLEDLEVDITGMVEHWIAGDKVNYGMMVKLSGTYEASASLGYKALDSNVVYNPTGSTDSYYTKRFFARGSQFFFKRPHIEARWDSAERDDRSNFFYSASRAPAADNLNTIYFYNIVRGRLRNITGIPANKSAKIYVTLHSGNVDNSGPTGSEPLKLSKGGGVVAAGHYNATGGWVSTGIYSCSLCVTAASTPIKTLYDVWHYYSSTIQPKQLYFTGSITPEQYSTGQSIMLPSYYISMPNLQNTYGHKETTRLSLYVRNKNWQPTIYTVANTNPPFTPIASASYRVYRLLDNYPAVPYGTGSKNHTGLSYDVSGNYFNFDMSVLEPGYAYAFKFAFYDEDVQSWQEQDTAFKFRVEEG